jgi:hypothetical protein
LHPCRGAMRGRTKPVVSLTLYHRLQAGMPPASDSDALVWFFCFRKMFCSNGYALSPTDARSPRSATHDPPFPIQCALGHLPVQAEARHFKKPHFRDHAPPLLTRPIENSEEPSKRPASGESTGCAPWERIARVQSCAVEAASVVFLPACGEDVTRKADSRQQQKPTNLHYKDLHNVARPLLK